MLKAISTITNALGALNYKGTWNASSNTPTLADGTGAKGDYYVTSTAGTQTFGGLQLFFGIGDWIVYNGAVWQRVEGGSDGNFSNVTLTSTDAGAAAAPTLDLYRDSASPAASDTLGEIEFNGKDSAGNKQQYAVIHGSILSATSTAEQGQIHFETATAGASTEKMIIGTTNLVINDIGAVFNVRIEGDTDANLFYTDATNSRIGIGTISPATKLDVNGSITSADLTASTAVVTDANKKLVSLVQPAVSAYKSTNQSISTTTVTKITFDTESFDTNNNFASSTFTPTVAGYYQISSGFYPSADSTTFSRAFLSIYKNGVEWQRLQDVTTIGTFITFLGANGSCLVYCNGTTDYIEAYGFITGTNPVIGSGSAITYFDAVLVRGA